MEIRYISLDDNPQHLLELNNLLDMVPLAKRLGEFSDPEEALRYLEHNPVDVVFMDIEMPKLTGIEVAKQLLHPPLFVFISSHPEFGAETYEVDALDYILKPLTLERLLKSFKKIYTFLESKQHADQEIKTEGLNQTHFFIKENQQYVRLECEEVLYVESLNSFVHIFLRSGKKHLVLVGLKSLEEQLPPNLFLRISRSILVHKNKISAFTGTHVYLGQLCFPIGTTYMNKIQEALQAFTISRFSGGDEKG
jgi:DNA-binding LytR/AlgR family response regulator